MSDASGESHQEDPMATHLVGVIEAATEKLQEAGLGPGDRYRLEIRLRNAKNDLKRHDEALWRELGLS